MLQLDACWKGLSLLHPHFTFGIDYHLLDILLIWNYGRQVKGKVTAGNCHDNTYVLFDHRFLCHIFHVKMICHKSGTSSHKSGNHFPRSTKAVQSPTKVAIMMFQQQQKCASALNLVYIVIAKSETIT